MALTILLLTFTYWNISSAEFILGIIACFGASIPSNTSTLSDVIYASPSSYSMEYHPLPRSFTKGNASPSARILNLSDLALGLLYIILYSKAEAKNDVCTSSFSSSIISSVSIGSGEGVTSICGVSLTSLSMILVSVSNTLSISIWLTILFDDDLIPQPKFIPDAAANKTATALRLFFLLPMFFSTTTISSFLSIT